MPPDSTSQPTQKKKLPGWLKVLIVVVIVFVGLSVAASIGMTLLGRFLSSKGGEKLAREGIEKFIEKEINKELAKEGLKGKIDFDVDEESLVIRDEKSGEQLAFHAAKKMPEGFPSDVPLFSPAEIQHSAVIGPMQSLMLKTSASLADVTDFYKDRLASEGWTAEGTFAMQQGFTGLYNKEGRRLTVSITPLEDEGAVAINLAHGVK